MGKNDYKNVKNIFSINRCFQNITLKEDYIIYKKNKERKKANKKITIVRYIIGKRENLRIIKSKIHL